MLFRDCSLTFDAPTPWGLFFQDSATPLMEGLEELHNNIMFYLVIILFIITWMMINVIVNFVNYKAPFKYVNHGRNVPIKKCFKFSGITVSSGRRFISTASYTGKLYEDIYSRKNLIVKDNRNKSGIYMWTNKLTNDAYVGQAKNLSHRFLNYFNPGYLRNRGTLVINRALLKYGYSNFSLTVLEYCSITELTEREQYYIDKFNPKYNTLKIAGSSLGYRVSEETKLKISNSLKGVYVREKSALFGRTYSVETRAIMSLKKSGKNNPLFGKNHSEATRELMRQKALGRKHSEETLLKMSSSKGYPVYIYEKCDSKGFKLIGNFVSIRRAAKFLGVSSNTIRSYVNSGKIFRNRYKFSGALK